MTTLRQLKTLLATSPAGSVTIQLPDGDAVPAHFHVTEVGQVRKDFIDCGGNVRSSATCVIQTWVANDRQHRLDSAKLAKIIASAQRIITSDDLPVEIEYEGAVVSQYPLQSVDSTADGLVFRLGRKHTACAVPELCVVSDQEECCTGSGCC